MKDSICSASIIAHYGIKDINIHNVFEDSRITMLEKDIASWNEHCRYTKEEKHVQNCISKQWLRIKSTCIVMTTWESLI